MIAAVLADMDGTLVDGESIWDTAHRKTAVDLGGTLTDAAAASLLGADVSASVATISAATGHRHPPALIRAALLDRVADLYAGGVPWMPGAEALLDDCAAAGLPVALVTNSPRRITDLALDGMGRTRFAATVCADECTAGKPDPAPYLRAAHLLGVAIRDCLVIEDSADGARAGHAAGATVLAIAAPAQRHAGYHRYGLAGLTSRDLDALGS